MKAISLWQPWATALAIGSKRVETRHWSTKVRGPVVIHAAKRCVKDELIFWGSSWNWCGALASVGLTMGKHKPLWELLPFGALIGIGDLVDCRPTESFTQGELDSTRLPDRDHADLYKWTERQMGDFSLGRFGWIFENVRAFEKPIPYKGSQGFFDVSSDLIGEEKFIRCIKCGKCLTDDECEVCYYCRNSIVPGISGVGIQTHAKV
jgi:hypothetical protein